LAAVIIGSLAVSLLNKSYGAYLDISAAIPIVALIVGIIIFLCGFLGCCGSLRKSLFICNSHSYSSNSRLALRSKIQDCNVYSDYFKLNKIPPRTCELENWNIALSVEVSKFTFVLPVFVIVFGLIQFLAVVGACGLANSIKRESMEIKG
uniref:Tetraspanin-6 n=1 Tax=Schistocephalus solidus TaxID=70667 RepID=A0A183TH48_SCHSO